MSNRRESFYEMNIGGSNSIRRYVNVVYIYTKGVFILYDGDNEFQFSDKYRVLTEGFIRLKYFFY